MQDEIIICKCDPNRYYDGEDLFDVKSPIGLLQTYSGIHNFNTVMKIIDGYKPEKILVYGANMHGSTIVNFIFEIQSREYKLRIFRTVFRNDKIVNRIIILRCFA